MTPGSLDSASPHYFDQAALYSEKRFKPAWFSRPDVEANAVRTEFVGRSRPADATRRIR